MSIAQQIWDAIGRVHDQVSFLNGLLHEALGWPVPDARCVEDISYGWSAEELNAIDLNRKVAEGGIWQIQPFTSSQPWGVFLLEFKNPDVFTKGRGITTPLRSLLRGLVPRKRASARPADRRSWEREDLLFICTHDYRHFRFAYFKAPAEGVRTAPLATFGWNEGDTHIRTLSDWNLAALEFPEDEGSDPDAWLDAWRKAFDVEAVTRRFFEEYRQVFEHVESQVKGVPSGEPRRLYTQRLFNRLMFLYFIQKKGWLSYRGDGRYLRALFEHTEAKGQDFLNDRLYSAFFHGLNVPRDSLKPKDLELLRETCGDLPYLNGGLFEALEDQFDVRGAARIPNQEFARILALFERYNFTITESTPLDIEVAVDPEMLGKVFEELVTGRHETGSYYTPKPVVAFMCRESLKGYLRTALPAQSPDAIDRFVEEHDPAGLRDPEAALNALRTVRVCDPACGSGAYLLGMLHELLALRTCLFATRHLDPISAYQRKLEIVENNVYGVDIDPFAVNIARLRLWLSLAVEFDGPDPPPLPNLDFKIECGDSLTAPAPQAAGQQAFRHALIRDFREAKTRYMTAHANEKPGLKKKITKLRDEIAAWTHAGYSVTGFDWPVEFAEVFADGGFDIVLANPPYVRQELLGREYKESGLKPVFPETYTGTADLYVYFFTRAHQVLRRQGIGCFISSNKWLRAGYGEKLRQHLLDAQAFRLVVDFGELPVFQAATFPAIFLWQKQSRGNSPTTWAVVKDLPACYDEGILEHVSRIAQTVPASQFGKGKPRLATSTAAERRAKMEARGPRLGALLKGGIFRGPVTGLNEAFIIDRATRDRLVDEDHRSADIIKPLLKGDDVRRYEVHFRGIYLIYARHSIAIKHYPAVFAHLRNYEARLRQKAGSNEWYELQASPGDEKHIAFDRQKIMYPEIAKEARYTMDFDGHYPADTVHIIVSDNWYLLGVLNSVHAFEYLKGTCSVLGDEDKAGRLRFKPLYMETLPIPDASAPEREPVAKLAREAQRLHTQRRQRVERFLGEIGIEPAQSSSRNPLEEPWKMTGEQFARRTRGLAQQVFGEARDETAALTDQILNVEREIDERVAGLYGL